MQKMIKKILTITLIIIMLLSMVGIMTGCDDPNRYTKEQHIQRISKRVEQRLNEGHFKGFGGYYFENITDFAVYPIYNNDDKLVWFLIEFEPIGYIYVVINYNRSPFSGTAMYSYNLGENCKSHFGAIGITDENRYFLLMEHHGVIQAYMPSVKRDDKWINVISMEEMELVCTDSECDGQKKYPEANVWFMDKPEANL